MLRQSKPETEEERIARIKRQNEEIRRREQKILEDKKFAEEQGAGFKVVVTNEKWPRETAPSYPTPPRNNTPRNEKSSVQSRLGPKREEFKSPRLANGVTDGPPPDPRSFLADDERDFDEGPGPFSNEKQHNDFRGRRNDRNRGGGLSRRLDMGERQWRDDRKNIDDERIQRSKAADGRNWKREWDQDKYDEPQTHVELTPPVQVDRTPTQTETRRRGTSGARGNLTIARGLNIRRTIVNDIAQKEPTPPKMSEVDEILERITEVHLESPKSSNVTYVEETSARSYPPPSVDTSFPPQPEYQDVSNYPAPSAAMSQQPPRASIAHQPVTAAIPQQSPVAVIPQQMSAPPLSHQNQYTVIHKDRHDPYQQHADVNVYPTINDYLDNQRAGVGIYSDQVHPSVNNANPYMNQQTPDSNTYVSQQIPESSPYLQHSHIEMTNSSKPYKNQQSYNQETGAVQYVNQAARNQHAEAMQYTNPSGQNQVIYSNQSVRNQTAEAMHHTNQQAQYPVTNSNLYGNEYTQSQGANVNPYGNEQAPTDADSTFTTSHHSRNQNKVTNLSDSYLHQHSHNQVPDSNTYRNQHIRRQTMMDQQTVAGNYNFPSENKAAQHVYNNAQVLTENPSSQQSMYQQVTSHNYHRQPAAVEKRRAITSVPVEPNTSYTEHASHPRETHSYTPETIGQYSTENNIPALPDLSVPPPSLTIPPKTIAAQTPAIPHFTNKDIEHFNAQQEALMKEVAPTMQHYATQDCEIYAAPTYVTSQTNSPFVSSQTQSPYVTSQTQSPYVTSQTQSPYVTSQTQSPYVTSQTQSPYVTSQTQSTYVTSQTQSPYVTSQTQTPYVTSQTQPPYVTSQTQSPYVTSQTQSPYVASQTQSPYVTSQIQNNSVTYHDNSNLTYVQTVPYTSAPSVNQYELQQDGMYYVGSQAVYEAQANVQYNSAKDAGVNMVSTQQYYEANNENQHKPASNQNQMFYSSEPSQPQSNAPVMSGSVQNRLQRIRQEKFNVEQSHTQNQGPPANTFGETAQVTHTEIAPVAKKPGKSKNFSFLKAAIQENQESLKEYLLENQEVETSKSIEVIQLPSSFHENNPADIENGQTVTYVHKDIPVPENLQSVTYVHKDIPVPENLQSVTYVHYPIVDSHSKYGSKHDGHHQSNIQRTRNFKPRTNFEANKSTTNNKFNTNFKEYDNLDYDRKPDRFSGRPRQSHNANTPPRFLNRVTNRSHEDSPKAFKTIESTRGKDGHGESYLQDKLKKAKENVGAKKETKKHSLSPKEKREVKKAEKKSEPAKAEKFDWFAECENNPELIEREAKANGLSVAHTEDNTSSNATLSDVSNDHTNTDENTENQVTFEKLETSQDKVDETSSSLEQANETTKCEEDGNSSETKEEMTKVEVKEVEGQENKVENKEAVTVADEEVEEEDDEEWEDLSDEEDKKKNKKKYGGRYGGYYGRY
ncbi:hypothetical protein M8J75_008372 [Diaphorina citri]|nr:hypothetical protein M8J75_008372 [Diaphorina citri]